MINKMSNIEILFALFVLVFVCSTVMFLGNFHVNDICHCRRTSCFISRCDCYDYLKEIGVEMKKVGMDTCGIPELPKGAYLQY